MNCLRIKIKKFVNYKNQLKIQNQRKNNSKMNLRPQYYNNNKKKKIILKIKMNLNQMKVYQNKHYQIIH